MGISLLIAALACPVVAVAATLEVPPEQIVEPGQWLQLPLVLRQEQGPRIEISLGVAPPGVSLELMDDGQLQLEWLAGTDMPAESTIELLVRDVDSDVYLDSVFVKVRRAGTVPEEPIRPEDEEPASGAEPGQDPLPASTAGDDQQGQVDGSLDAPVLETMPNQVVSVGRTVILEVFATLPGEFDPVLLIDRLPRNASFEANDEGGRTFRWETSDVDQGEHLFRFTAFNPRAPQQRSVQEVWMVVGDPTRNVTLPEPMPNE